ncbi:MAG: hypothetical protein ACE5DW_06815 [Thermodesulfobacteriota bacterium]
MEFILPIFILSVMLVMLLIIKRAFADGRAESRRELYAAAEEWGRLRLKFGLSAFSEYNPAAIAEARVKNDLYAGARR